MAEGMADSNAEQPKETKLVTAIVIGAGNRGQTYAGYALDFPDKLKGEITYSGGTSIHVFDFLTRLTKEIYPWSITPMRTRLTGHGYADFFLMHNFVDAVANDDASLILTGPDDTLESHLMTFAAERARRQNRVVTIEPPMDW